MISVLFVPSYTGLRKFLDASEPFTTRPVRKRGTY
jgi:hypothetical protein